MSMCVSCSYSPFHTTSLQHTVLASGVDSLQENAVERLKLFVGRDLNRRPPPPLGFSIFIQLTSTGRPV